MERAAWTNERLDDLAEAMRSGFARVDNDIRDLRVEMREFRAEMREEIAGLRGEIVALKTTLLRAALGWAVGSLAVIAALLTRI